MDLQFLMEDTYQDMAKKTKVKNDNELAQEERSCNHFNGINENISPKALDCEGCKKDQTEWIALRLCLACGHVGCCDSSIGMHATKHFVNTGHPVIVALPNKTWKWCYLHKVYG